MDDVKCGYSAKTADPSTTLRSGRDDKGRVVTFRKSGDMDGRDKPGDGRNITVTVRCQVIPPSGASRSVCHWLFMALVFLRRFTTRISFQPLVFRRFCSTSCPLISPKNPPLLKDPNRMLGPRMGRQRSCTSMSSFDESGKLQRLAIECRGGATA
jgi:hypothetical protein